MTLRALTHAIALAVLAGVAASPAQAAPGRDLLAPERRPGTAASARRASDGSSVLARARSAVAGLLRWPPPPPDEVGPGLSLAPWGPARPRPVADWARAMPGGGVVDDGSGEALPVDAGVPRVRLEAYLRVAPLVRSKVKHGREGLAHSWTPAGDANVPDTPALGQRWLIDLKVHRWLSIGVAWSQVVVDGPRRGVHYRGLSHQATYFPPDSRVSTTVDVQTGEAWLRLVVSDDDRVRVAVGLGAVWASHRTTLHRGDLGAGARVETFFTPTISYLLAARLGELPAWVFFESVTAPFGPWRFPSAFSESRAGLRLDLGAGLELVLAASFASGSIADTDDLWGGKPRPGKRWRTATWYVPAGEVGLAWIFG